MYLMCKGYEGWFVRRLSCWEVSIGHEGTLLCKLSVLNYCLYIATVYYMQVKGAG
jgi:hypothetical protein